MQGDTEGSHDAKWVNKMALRKYANMFEEGKKIVQMKTAEAMQKKTFLLVQLIIP